MTTRAAPWEKYWLSFAKSHVETPEAAAEGPAANAVISSHTAGDAGIHAGRDITLTSM
jgi:hypothetical protein